MEITKLSTKGQIVIPENFRKNFEVGSSFVVSKINEMIVLKPIKGLTKKEEKSEKLEQPNKVEKNVKTEQKEDNLEKNTKLESKDKESKNSKEAKKWNHI